MNRLERRVARLVEVTHRYGKALALDLTLDIPAESLVGVIGPDGVGKWTLLSIVAGAKRIQNGTVQVLDGDMAELAHRALSARVLHSCRRGWDGISILT